MQMINSQPFIQSFSHSIHDQIKVNIFYEVKFDQLWEINLLQYSKFTNFYLNLSIFLILELTLQVFYLRGSNH